MANEFFKVTSSNTLAVPFDEIFERDIAFINDFHLNKKRSYCNCKELIVQSNNDLLKNDKDNSIIFNYLVMKYKIVDTENYTKEDFKKDLYEILVNEELLELVDEYVENGYTLDLDSESQENNKKYNEKLQFTDKHCKVLLKISTIQKLIIPLVLEYIYQSGLATIDIYLHDIYDELFTIYEDREKINILNKLYESTKSKIIVTRYSDAVFWYYVENYGSNIDTFISSTIQKIIVDIVPKYELDKNIVSLNHAVVNNTRANYLRFNFPYNFKTLDMVSKGDDDLSDFDRMEISNSKINESENVINDFNVKELVEICKEQTRGLITLEEYKHYLENLKINKLQKQIVILYYAKYFGSCQPLYNIDIKGWTMILLSLKKKLEDANFIYLPKILTATVDQEINERKAIKKVQIVKIFESERFKNLIKKKYGHTSTVIFGNNVITTMISTVLNTKFLSTEFDEPNNMGKEIKINADILSDEVLRFLEEI